MNHIKQDFSPKAWVQPPGVDLGGGAYAKIKLFSEYGHFAPSTSGLGLNGNHFFWK